MCGRFTLHHTWAEIHAQLSVFKGMHHGRNLGARYNIAPTQDVLFAHTDQNGQVHVKEGLWWLVPHWAKELQSKYPMFNARSEDAEKKPAFREAYKTSRCLIPASGYYEWTRGEDGKKDPWLLHLLDTPPFVFAGLWAHNNALDVTSCTIMTAAAAPEIKHIHNRMPIILKEKAHATWLDCSTPVKDAKAALADNHGRGLQAYRVSRKVNSSKSDESSMIEPIDRGNA